MERIKEVIKEKLSEIEKCEGVKILHCVESGSRVWGFPSPDSDYDVRFIYVRQKEHYLRLDKTRDVIEWQLDETLDISGWDLQKMLRLLYKSNPTVFEWKNSPIVYKTTEEWKRIADIIDEYFSIKSGIYHYLHMAQSNYAEYLKGERVRLKKYFYVLRPVLACRYIKTEKQAPPMRFEELLTLAEPEVRQEISKLLELKATTSELGMGDAIPCINEYIERQFVEIEAFAKTVPFEEKRGCERLNIIFLSVL